jgi:hypothetical protein
VRVQPNLGDPLADETGVLSRSARVYIAADRAFSHRDAGFSSGRMHLIRALKKMIYDTFEKWA